MNRIRVKKGCFHLKLDPANDYEATIDMDATQLSAGIKEQKVTPLEAVETYIHHITKINPRINAMVETRFTEATDDAKEKSSQKSTYALEGKLDGVPISVKESFDVKGMRTTSGILDRKDAKPDEDATVIKKLKHEGAIILGKTNTPEMCFCQETENKLYGRTNNPWDLKCTAGGSSGGEGAFHAVGGAAVGIGADIGGSVRFPSHFNGVVGMKSGKNQVPANGSFPSFTIPLQKRMLGLGPMGKSVGDIRLLYDIVAENPPASKKANRVQVDVLPRGTGYPLSSETARVLNDIAEFLGNYFAVDRTIPPFFNDGAQIWQEIMSIEAGRDIARTAAPGSKGMVREFVKEKIAKNGAVHPYLSWALIGTKMFQPSAKRIKEIELFLEHGDETLHDYLAGRLLILPVYHSAAPRHGKVYNEIFSIRKTFKKYMPYVAYANVWGLPALTVPVATDAHGMPIGVQILCRNDDEDLLFQVGEKLEEQFGGYERCRRFDEQDGQ